VLKALGATVDTVDMRRRSSAFWQGPGVLLAFVFLLLAAGGLLFLAAAGPRVINGLALAALGAAVIYYRDGFGEYSYESARRTYIWPRDPDQMKPNAELEQSIGTAYAAVVGGVLLISGLAWAVAGLS